MDKLTLGAIAGGLALVAGILGSVKIFINIYTKSMEKVLAPIYKRLSDIEMSYLKSDLTNFLADVEHDVPKSQIQKLNAHEQYDKYTENGGNSYIHEHWEEQKRLGKI